MKYDAKKYKAAVSYYKKAFKGKVKEKTILVELEAKNKEAYFSLAPLSQAIHDLGGDLDVTVQDGKNASLEAVKQVWHIIDESKRRVKSKKVKALPAPKPKRRQ